MKKKIFLIATCLVVFIACGRHKPQRPVDTPTGNKPTTEAVQPEENQQLQPEETRIWREMNAALEGNLTDIQEPAEGKSLNEIRFEG